MAEGASGSYGEISMNSENVSDVKIYDDEALQQGIRFNLFHIMQSAGRDGTNRNGRKGTFR